MIPYVRDIKFEYGQVDQVSPLIRRVIANNPGPFTFTGTGTYIIGKGEGVAVIDPGPDQPEHLQAILDATQGERVSHILITHHHLDHSPLARPLAAKTGATVYGCAVGELPAEDGVRTEAGYDRFDAGRRRLRRRRPSPARTGPSRRSRRPATPPTTSATRWPRRTAASPATTSWAGRRRWCRRRTATWPTTSPASTSIQGRNFKTLWPTHGPPITEPGPFIDAYRAHRMERERQILAQLAAGKTRIVDMVPAMYVGVDARLYPAAGRSVLAHMIQLVQNRPRRHQRRGRH